MPEGATAGDRDSASTDNGPAPAPAAALPPDDEEGRDRDRDRERDRGQGGRRKSQAPSAGGRNLFKQAARQSNLLGQGQGQPGQGKGPSMGGRAAVADSDKDSKDKAVAEVSGRPALTRTWPPIPYDSSRGLHVCRRLFRRCPRPPP